MEAILWLARERMARLGGSFPDAMRAVLATGARPGESAPAAVAAWDCGHRLSVRGLPMPVGATCPICAPIAQARG